MELPTEEYKPYPHTNPFYKKGYGRIYVRHEKDIPRVKEIIKQLDDYEWSYFPHNDFVVPWTGFVDLVYTHKFEACQDAITLRCLKENIWVWCISQHREKFQAEYLLEKFPKLTTSEL